MLFVQPNSDGMPIHDEHSISIILGAVRKISRMCNELRKKSFRNVNSDIIETENIEA